MHLADGILPAGQIVGWTAATSAALAYAARRFAAQMSQSTVEQRALQRMGMALLFAVTLLPVPVPIAGLTAHMCAAPVVGLLVGFVPTLLASACVLLVQALFFAHGGLGSLGANVFTLGIVGPAVAIVADHSLARLGAGRFARTFVACTLADWLTYITTAGILASALAGERDGLHWFGLAVGGLAPAQVPLGLVEGWLSAHFLLSLERRRPEIFDLAGPRAVGVTFLAIAILVASPPGVARAAGYDGADEVVLERLAESAGRTPSTPVDLPGELEDSLRCVLCFAAGAVFASSRRVVTRGEE